MKEKVVRSSNNHLSTTANDEQVIPSNILICTLATDSVCSITSPSTNSSCSNSPLTFSNPLLAQQQMASVSHALIISSSSNSTTNLSINEVSIVPSDRSVSKDLLKSFPQPTNAGDTSSPPDNHLSADVRLSSSQQCLLDQQGGTNTKEENFFDSCTISSFSEFDSRFTHVFQLSTNRSHHLLLLLFVMSLVACYLIVIFSRQHQNHQIVLAALD